MHYVLPFLLIGPALLAIGALYQWAGASRDHKKYPPPGRMVKMNGHRLHLRENEGPGPPVVLEAGIVATSLSWSLVQPAIAKFARVCSYDRPGLGWSEPLNTTITTRPLAEDLHLLLKRAGVQGPFVLVAHSFGSFVVRNFAALFPEDVVGLVLVDPVFAGEWAPLTREKSLMLSRGVRLSRRGALLARFGVVRLSLMLLEAGARRLPRMVAHLSSGRSAVVTERIAAEVAKLPREVWPMVRAHWSRTKSFAAMAEYLASLPASAAQVSELPPLGDIPLVVLTARSASPEHFQEQRAIASLSRRGTQVVASKSGHWIHLDEPELIVDAVRGIVEKARHQTAID
jgi:pimeloyl-ACP methyl ester carboxylesterase